MCDCLNRQAQNGLMDAQVSVEEEERYRFLSRAFRNVQKRVKMEAKDDEDVV